MTILQTKHSSTASAVPTAAVLIQGELAVNVTDKRLFTENNSGVVVELGTNPTSLTTGSIAVTGTVDGRDVAADGTKLDGIEASADVTDTTNVVASLTAGANVTIAADGTISSSTGADTTYTAGSGLSLTGTVFANSAPDQTVALTGAGATSVSGTYPNFTITSTNTTYSVGDGGLTQINFTSADNTKLDNIESGATADQSASEILTAIKTVDGTGSGLDADTVDGFNISTASTGTDANTIYFRT